jgi:transcriptional regulator of met regulon
VNREPRYANPPYGQRGNFRKLTVTLPQEVYERLVTESARRKIAGKENQLFSELLREAIIEYLDRLDSEAHGI